MYVHNLHIYNATFACSKDFPIFWRESSYFSYFFETRISYFPIFLNNHDAGHTVSVKIKLML